MGGKTSLSIRDSLRLDLKDPGSNGSNAELDRCIQRAVSDLSRMLPLEKVYEKRLSFTVTDEAYTSPVDTDADRFVDAQRLDGSGTDMTAGDTFTLTGTQPDFPRVVTITLTDSAAVASLSFSSSILSPFSLVGYDTPLEGNICSLP